MRKSYDFSNAVQGVHHKDYEATHAPIKKGIAAWYLRQPEWLKTISVSAFVMVLLGVLIVGFIAHELSPRSMCGSNGSHTQLSPDSTRRAVLYEFDCGATTDFGTHLAVESTKRKFDPFDADEDSLVFSADSNHGHASTDSAGLLHVDMHWADSSHLVVYVPAGARVFTEKTTSGPVSIEYKADNP